MPNPGTRLCYGSLALRKRQHQWDKFTDCFVTFHSAKANDIMMVLTRNVMMLYSRRDWFVGVSCSTLLMSGCNSANAAKGNFEFKLSDAEWRKRLSSAAYETLRRSDTERPYTSPLNNEKRRGVFSCGGCALPLFSSATKFESGTGWPSFWQPLANSVAKRTDYDIGYPRTEVHCRRCGGHLGHVFSDGPKPTGKRYCINGIALIFKQV
jgi:peptide-methionine (R)-S-oxide reductase